MGARIVRHRARSIAGGLPAAGLATLAVVAALPGCSRTDLILVYESADDGGPGDGPATVDAPAIFPGRDADGLDAPVRDAHDHDVAAADVVVRPDTGVACCGEEQNTDYPPDTNCGGTTIAWQYVPSCAFAVSRIELHKNGGLVALLDSDAAGAPGATIWSGTLGGDPNAPPDWNGADVVPPVALVPGHLYYLEEGQGVCSIATGGVEYAYYGLEGNGAWSGPYQWHYWTSHVVGVCH